jgi:hypothetical protein
MATKGSAKKVDSLQKSINAVNPNSGRRPAIVAPAASPTPIATGKPSGRVGHANISAWLPKEFKRSIRLVQARKGDDKATLQDLMGEAFNDLFSKYDVPTIPQD